MKRIFEDEAGHFAPADIEKTSMQIITKELIQRKIELLPGTEAVVKRVIHTTADFDYAENLKFSDRAVEKTVSTLRKQQPDGLMFITDTNMAKAGINKQALSNLGCLVRCYMGEPEIKEAAHTANITRASASMKAAAKEYPDAVYVIGNAPTALLTLSDIIESSQLIRPALIIASPVGFVNVEESKLRITSVCEQYGIPFIAAMGRKGGSSVAAAICNALLYIANGTLDPKDRM